MNHQTKNTKKYLWILYGLLCALPIFSFGQTLTNNSTITITKTWSQQPNGYTYPIDIYVPVGAVPSDGFPVCISLHGNGGQGNVNAWRNTLPNHIIVAPSGYERSWNIADENSDAPDVEMINDLVDILQTYTNVNPNKIRILGTSNGAALANRVFIENKDIGIDIVCAFVSHLSTANYHDNGFYFPSGATGDNGTGTPPFEGYDTPTTPITGRRYLNISNTNDGLIPYYGGNSPVGVTFLDARIAAFIIAQSQGYTDSQVMDSTLVGGAVFEFKYLNGQVIHLSGDALHGNNQTQRNYVTTYFNTEITTSTPCEPNRDFTTTVQAGIYETSDTITCRSSLATNATVSFKANTIILQNGFVADATTTFTAQIAPCSNVSTNAKLPNLILNGKSKIVERANKLVVYPNPVARYLNIQTDAAINKRFELFSSLGQQIKVGTLMNGEAQIDLSSYTSNVYFLKVGKEVFKIQKIE